ncbi:MAG TPA: glucosidase, partial [Candidatus Dormibacteraeota bacterium]
MSSDDAERTRLRDDPAGWRRWGPYLSERAWGTVREDYSANGDAWNYVSHDQARSRAFRWSEEGLGGICDEHQLLCLAFSFWNGVDPILKERIFGLTGPQGNHGEDAKEYWWYIDSTPTHSWMRWRYLYPQVSFPYDDLIAESARRGQLDPEYELADTGVLDGGFWDITVDYAKETPEDLVIELRARNAGATTQTLHVLPTLWFRNTWAWGITDTVPVLHVENGRV